VHTQIKAFTDYRKVFFCDPSAALIDTGTGRLKDGCYTKDGIHLVENGYRIWAAELIAVILFII
jgi:lysophospholipase L1-like esterase